MKTKKVLACRCLGAIIAPALFLAFGASSNAQVNIYDTGYSTTFTQLGTVDNLWQITAVANLPSGYNLPENPPYSAFLITSGQAPFYDTSVGPSGYASKWLTFNNPQFDQTDANGIITTYTLNFSAAAGNYLLDYEADNGVSIYLGSVNSQDLVYSDGANQSDFNSWHPVNLDITKPGANQLNIQVLNSPSASIPTNPTSLRVDFTTNPVPEPSSLALLALGGVPFLLRGRKNTTI